MESVTIKTKKTAYFGEDEVDFVQEMQDQEDTEITIAKMQNSMAERLAKMQAIYAEDHTVVPEDVIRRFNLTGINAKP